MQKSLGIASFYSQPRVAIAGSAVFSTSVRPTATIFRLSVTLGHITITNYLLNYYSGLDIERRNCHGFTALMKAAMQGRVECVRSLMLAGKEMRLIKLNARNSVAVQYLEWVRL